MNNLQINNSNIKKQQQSSTKINFIYKVLVYLCENNDLRQSMSTSFH